MSERYFILKFTDGYFIQAPATIDFLQCARGFIDCEIKKLIMEKDAEIEKEE